MLRGISPALEVQDHVEAGFKHPELHGCGKFLTWKGLCMEYETLKRSGVGIFCSNFLRLRKPFPRVMWFGADNGTALTQRIPFEYIQVLPEETTKAKTWRRRKSSTSASG